MAANLFKNRIPVWVDKWELKVGDSIVKRIESAIENADALLVVLSRASVESEWCKKELTAGLIKELEEKSVFVMPIVIDNCVIPLFLRDKLYADFRTDKDKGLRDVLEATSRFTSDTLYRGSAPIMNTDYGLYYTDSPDSVEINLTLLDMPLKESYSVITEISIKGNKAMADRYHYFAGHGFDWFQREVMLSFVLEYVDTNKAGFSFLDDSFPEFSNFYINDSKYGLRLDVQVKSRRLGEDTGKAIVVDWGLSLKRFIERLVHEKDRLPPDTKARLEDILRR